MSVISASIHELIGEGHVDGRGGHSLFWARRSVWRRGMNVLIPMNKAVVLGRDDAMARPFRIGGRRKVLILVVVAASDSPRPKDPRRVL